jgi:prophage regulatory protein
MTHREAYDPRDMNTQITTALASPSTPDISFMRLPAVKSATGLSKSSLYALIRANLFPAPVQLGPRMVAWVRSEVQEWAVERVRLRDAA